MIQMHLGVHKCLEDIPPDLEVIPKIHEHEQLNALKYLGLGLKV